MTTPKAVAAELTALAATCPHRPAFHFTPPGGWMNDPNGLTQHDGTFHLYYQHNPDAPVHAQIHWGHATSTDLIRWTHQPIALEPSPGPDEDGCWSGVLVYDDGVPTLVYSGHHDDAQLPCLATGTPDLMSWTKSPANPVLAAPPEHLDLVAFRDHCVWQEGGKWRQIIGAGIRGKGGTALLYESPDLRSWKYIGELLTGDGAINRGEGPLWTGTMWECIDMFRLQDRDGAPHDSLVFSAWDYGNTLHPLYWTGTYRDDRFEPTDLHRLDFGGRHFYAPQSFQDESGRRIMFGWMQEARTDEAAVAAGWSGVMSLPRLVTVRSDGSLHQVPVPEVATLREEVLFDGDAATLSPDAIRGNQLDLELSATLPTGSSVTIHLAATSDKAESTVLTLIRSAGADELTISLDRSRSSLDESLDTMTLAGSIPAQADDRVELRILLDHSALEVFVDGHPMAARIYPTRDDARDVEVSMSGATGQLRAWNMAACSRTTQLAPTQTTTTQ